MSFRDLNFRLSYKSRGDGNIINDFLVPAMKQTKIYKRSVGFFSSSVFELTAAGIKSIVENKGEIRIICSPELDTADVQAIQLGYSLKNDLLDQRIREDILDAVQKLDDSNLILLVDLIKEGRLNIKVIDVVDSIGIYHDKMGILEDFNGNKALFIGSPNESKSAYLYNYEKIRVSVSWKEAERIEDDEEEFDNLWLENNAEVKYIDITETVSEYFENEKKKRKSVSGEKDFLRDYQKEAIAAWNANGGKGFYVMATGTGKTWTAIYTALGVMKKKDIFLVICAPYKHLVKQWCEDVKCVMGKYKIILISSENPNWTSELTEAIIESKLKRGKTVIAISTIKSFNSSRFKKISNKCTLKRMLIVDEAHRFKCLEDEYKEKYTYMLGLSATPANRKDDAFAVQLLDFFGGQVYYLPIEYAIKKGYLVHYNYHPIYVEATIQEEKDFENYTRLMMSCFRNGICVDLESLAKYKRARLRVIAMAEEKVSKIQWIISQMSEQDHFIVYCGDGKLYGNDDLRHIQFVKNELTERGFKVSQFTATENMEERMKIVDSFNRGVIDAMVAIRCLDEGINIPSIEGALLLASNDDYREFVQRRGRILRTHYNIYKDCQKGMANIYDVIVLPSDHEKDFAKIELRRFYEYARLADNSMEVFQELVDLLARYGLTKEDILITEDTEDELDE